MASGGITELRAPGLAWEGADDVGRLLLLLLMLH